MMPKKTKAEEENNLQEQENLEDNQDIEPTEKQTQDYQSLIRQLCHQGEACYQILWKWEQMNQHLKTIAEKLTLIEKQSKERNELLKEDIEN